MIFEYILQRLVKEFLRSTRGLKSLRGNVYVAQSQYNFFWGGGERGISSFWIRIWNLYPKRLPHTNLDPNVDPRHLLYVHRTVYWNIQILCSVLGIRDIWVRIRIHIRGSIPLNNGTGSGSDSFLQ
jgi:hypothetical protein